MSKVKIAIIGAGWVTQNCYLPHLGPDSPLEVVRIYDPDFEQARQVADALGLSHPASSLAECLDASIQSVIICSPNDTHLALLIRCLETEKFVLCEKPVLLDAKGMEAVQALPIAPRRLMGSATTRLRRDVELLLSWVRSGRVGEVRRITLGWWRQWGVPISKPWRISPLSCPTGVLEDLGPHLLDVAAVQLPAATTLRLEKTRSKLECRHGNDGRAASWYRQNGNASAVRYEIPDYARATLNFENGPELELEVCWAGDNEGDASQLTVEGTEGTAGLKGLFGFSTSRRQPRQFCYLKSRGRPTEIVEFAPGPDEQRAAFGKSIQTFARFCRGEGEPVAHLQEVFTVARWLTAIR